VFAVFFLKIVLNVSHVKKLKNLDPHHCYDLGLAKRNIWVQIKKKP